MATVALHRPCLGLLAILLLPALAGCLGEAEPDPDVVASFYPLGYVADRIAGDLLIVETAVPDGVEPHAWEPGVRDVAGIAQAELLLAQGLGMDPWVDTIGQNLGGAGPRVVVTTDGLHELIENEEAAHEEAGHEENASGEDHPHDEAHGDGNATHADDNATGEDDPHDEAHADEHATHSDGDATHADDHHDDDVHDESAGDAHDDDHGHAHEDGPIDPHTWLDPRTLTGQAVIITAALTEAWPEHEATFRDNLASLRQALTEVDRAYFDSLEDCALSVVIANHDAYGYLERRYDFTVESVSGLSPEAEPSARTLDHLAKLAAEHDIDIVFLEELADPRVIEVLAKEIDAEVRVLSPLEGLTAEQEAAGEDLLSLMHKNRENLQAAMRCAEGAS